MTFMVENMSSYFTAFADARGLQGSPPLVLPASFTPYQGFYPAPKAQGQLSQHPAIRYATRRIDG